MRSVNAVELRAQRVAVRSFPSRQARSPDDRVWETSRRRSAVRRVRRSSGARACGTRFGAAGALRGRHDIAASSAIRRASAPRERAERLVRRVARSRRLRRRRARRDRTASTRPRGRRTRRRSASVLAAQSRERALACDDLRAFAQPRDRPSCRRALRACVVWPGPKATAYSPPPASKSASRGVSQCTICARQVKRLAKARAQSGGADAPLRPTTASRSRHERLDPGARRFPRRRRAGRPATHDQEINVVHRRLPSSFAAAHSPGSA